MKLGLGTDAVNAISLKIIPGFSADSDQNEERFVVNRFQDGSVETLDFGARVSREVSLTFVNLLKADYITLVDYLDANSGLKIKITEENVDEKLFTETWTPTAYYCYLLGFSQLQEEDFSTTRGLFSVKCSLALAGEAAADEINAADSALLDALIEIDTVCADYVQAGDPGAVADGLRWLDTDDN